MALRRTRTVQGLSGSAAGGEIPAIAHHEALRPVEIGLAVLLPKGVRIVPVRAIPFEIGHILTPGISALESDAVR